MENTMHPVLIVGAGPTGLVTALELKRRGIPCRVIDQLALPSDKSKALGILPRNLETFEDMGIVTPFLEQGLQIHTFNFHLGGKDLSFRLTSLETHYPFILSLPQCETEKIFENRLKELGGVVERGVKLVEFSQENDTVSALLQLSDGSQQKATASWLIGCDGAKSITRKTLDLQFGGETYVQHFALADVDITGDINPNEPHFFISDRGQFLILPIPGGYARVIVVDMPVKTQDPNPEPTLKEIQRVIDERSSKKIKLDNPRWLSAFQIHKCKASGYRKGRAFIAGDAVHIHSPAGGQGMNTGIQDAYNLAWKLALVVKGEAPESLLDSYEKERMPVAENILLLTDEMTQFMATQSLFHRIFRRILACFVLPRDFFRKKIINRLSQLEISYRESPIVGQDRASSAVELGLRAGDKAVDVEGLVIKDQEKKRLLELLDGKEHVLILFSGESNTDDQIDQLIEISSMAEKAYPQLISSMLIIGGSKKPPKAEIPNLSIVLDPRLNLHERWGMQEAGFYLVRPDKYIAYKGKLPGKSLFFSYLDRLFKARP